MLLSVSARAPPLTRKTSTPSVSNAGHRCYSKTQRRAARVTRCLASTSITEPSSPSGHTSGEEQELPQTAQISGSSADVPGAVKHVFTVPEFLDKTTAETLRCTYDAKFANPSQLSGERFCWDYWHVPGQYTQMRTPAEEYFQEEDYAALEEALLEYGRQKLGCVGITPVWLSYYVDGCEQELHCDNLHGPWAFVLSLTRWSERAFSGGETMLLQPDVLKHWATHTPDIVVERKQLMQLVEPKFNQLTVFDPRVPHGVRPVRGTRDPREARLVLHGWFVEPDAMHAEMFVEGALSYDDATEVVNECMDHFAEAAEGLPEATGTLVLRISVAPSGTVQNIIILTDTLVPRPWECGPRNAFETSESGSSQEESEQDLSSVEAAVRGHIIQAAVDCFSTCEYPAADSESVITMPLLFE